MNNTCLRCGSEKIIPDLPVVVQTSATTIVGLASGSGTADVYVAGNPKAWLYTDAAAGGLTVRVCGACGHAELHAKNFGVLYEKHQKSRQT